MSEPHTCHNMQPPFPGPCGACERELSDDVLKRLRAEIVTTLMDDEYQRARAWRDRWLDAEPEGDMPDPLDPQIVAYLVADSEQLRKLGAIAARLNAKAVS